MTFRTTGIIIGKRDFRDYDRLFTIYTVERGKIQAMAQGSKKLASKLAGNLELLNYGTFTIAQGKTIDRIATVDVHDSFTSLKSDLEKLVSALHCFEILDQCVKWEECDEALFGHLKECLETLRTISGAQRVRVAHFFLLKMRLVLGYQPTSLENAEHVLESPLIRLLKTHKALDFKKLVQTFYKQHLDRPLRSREYFDFLAGTS